MSASPIGTRPTAPPTKQAMAATVNIIVNPMIVWIWIGGGIVALGGLFAISTLGRSTVPARRAQHPGEPRAEPAGAMIGGAD